MPSAPPVLPEPIQYPPNSLPGTEVVVSPPPAAGSAAAAAVETSPIQAIAANTARENVHAIPDPAAQRAQITALTLINCDSNADIREITSGDTIDISQLPTRRLNMRADATAEVSRVLFSVNHGASVRNETGRPFAFFGDRGGKYLPWTPKLGTYNLTVTPFSTTGQGQISNISFTVIDSGSGKPDAPPLIVEQPAEHSANALQPDTRASLNAEAVAKTQPVVPEIMPAPPPEPSIAQTQPKIPEIKPALKEKTDSPAEQADLQRLKPGGQAKHTLAQTLERRPVQSASGRCIGYVSSQTSELNVVCSHTLLDPQSARVVMPMDGAQGSVCDFLNATSPMITNCATSMEILAAFQRGTINVYIQNEFGEQLTIPVVRQ